MMEQAYKPLIIAIENLFYQYPDSEKPAINNISLKLEAGKYYVILGRNGSGKSTLARCINSLLKPTSGSVNSCGFDSSLPEYSYEILRRIAIVFQDPQTQIVGATVEEEVAFGPENIGLETGSIREKVDKALEITGITGIAEKQPQKLSLGQKQLVSIAGAVAMEPVFIISDESTSMLDDSARRTVLDLFLKLKKQGVGVIHVTHFLEEAIDADEVIVLDKGEVRAQGKPKEVLRDPGAVLEMGLEPLPVTLITREIESSGATGLENIITVEGLISWLKD